MSQAESYQQRTKNIARVRALRHAIRTLTERRTKAPIVQLNELKETSDFALSIITRHLIPGPKGTKLRRLVREAIRKWSTAYRQAIKRVHPAELRVLYLCGPEPLNDLTVLHHFGVRPQNVWAVESSDNTYRSALHKLDQLPSIALKLHHGQLADFLESTPQQFDIIYFDATSPFGAADTMRPLLRIFAHGRLSPLSVLITNFAAPSQNENERERLVQLATAFFRSRHEGIPSALRTALDPAVYLHEPELLESYIRQNLPIIYSDLITRLIVLIARTLIPNARALSSRDVSRYYLRSSSTTETRHAADSFGDEILQPKGGPEATLATDEGAEISESSMRALVEDYIRRATAASIPAYDFVRSIHKRLAATDPLLTAMIELKLSGKRSLDQLASAAALIASYNSYDPDPGLISEELQTAIRQSWFDQGSRHRFSCDGPFPNLLLSSLLGVYGYPHYPNPRASRRFLYRAKKKDMYLDCIGFDQCRYFFDWFPTVGQVATRFRDPAFQILSRAIIDRIGWHDWSADCHPFRASAVPCWGETPSARAFDFGPRRTIT